MLQLAMHGWCHMPIGGSISYLFGDHNQDMFYQSHPCLTVDSCEPQPTLSMAVKSVDLTQINPMITVSGYSLVAALGTGEAAVLSSK